jgi:hypothetical protein
MRQQNMDLKSIKRGSKMAEVCGDVAVIIDYDNLFFSIRGSFNNYPNLEELLDASSRYGRVACCQAFADWSYFSKSIPSLFRAGVQPIFWPFWVCGGIFHCTGSMFSPPK